MTDSQVLHQPLADSSADVSVGDTLRRTRVAQGLSVGEVANALKLHPRQVEALESGRFDQLPGFAFTRGFLRNYARLLKIEAAPLLAGLQPPDSTDAMELAPASNARGDMPQAGRGRFRRSVIPGMLAALALFGIVVAGWYYDTQRKKPAEELVASLPPVAAPQANPIAEPAATPPAATQLAGTPTADVPTAAVVPAPAVVPAVPANASSVPTQPVPGGADRFVFEFAQDAWVEAKDNSGKVVFSRLGKAGSRHEFEAGKPLFLVIGNARNVKLERNGMPVDLGLSGKATIARLKFD